ncbi:hypothetical protein [Mycoplasmopsis synoviae]|uniref:hypothetical protein n=1 Tax=Mycoplasmopsis synoviae TaxID=2109 RepID=UPI0035637CE1
MNDIKEIVKPSLATADYVVIALYLTAVLGIGLFFFIQQIKRKKTKFRKQLLHRRR